MGSKIVETVRTQSYQKEENIIEVYVYPSIILPWAWEWEEMEHNKNVHLIWGIPSNTWGALPSSSKQNNYKNKQTLHKIG